jgi:hypothetical protein
MYFGKSLGDGGGGGGGATMKCYDGDQMVLLNG